MSALKATGGMIGLLGLTALIGSATGAQAPSGKTPAVKTDSGVMESGGCLWDNTLTDERMVAPFQCASLFDDFAVGPGGCTFSTFWTLGVWKDLPPGSGFGASISVYSDAAGQPGAQLVSAGITSYSEVATGRTWSGRAEAEVNVTFDPVDLPEGQYWIKMRILGFDIWSHVTGCGAGAQGSSAWVDDCLVPGPRPIGDLAGDFCHAISDVTWRLGN